MNNILNNACQFKNNLDTIILVCVHNTFNDICLEIGIDIDFKEIVNPKDILNLQSYKNILSNNSCLDINISNLTLNILQLLKCGLYSKINNSKNLYEFYLFLDDQLFSILINNLKNDIYNYIYVGNKETPLFSIRKETHNEDDK